VTPIGNWKLDEGFGGSALDSSGNGFNGALTNGPVWTAGRSGSALVFDGVNDYVDLGNPPALQITGAMTLSAWVNPKSTLYNGRIISKGSGPGLRGWSLNVENYNVFEFSVAANTNDAATWVDSTTQVPLNTWTHVVGVFQPGAALRIYINGVLSGSKTTAVPITQFNPPVNVRIGGRNDGYSFDGIIDEVRVYDRALTAVEIQQLYADPSQTTPAAPSGVTPSTPAAPTTPPATGAVTPPPVITTRPDAPNDLNSVCNNATTVTLSWAPVSTATTYFLRVNDSINPPNVRPNYVLDDVTHSTMTLTVLPGHQYNWWVHAANPFGLSASRRGVFSCP